jgi:flagellin
MAQQFSVINNLSSAFAQKNLYGTNLDLNKTLARLSSGRQIIEAADNAAGLFAASGLQLDNLALTQATQNASNGIGVTQIADSTLAQTSDLLGRATTLASQAANGLLDDRQRGAINTEYQQILAEIDRSVDQTNFRGEQVLSKTGAVQKSIFVGDTNVPSTITVSIGGSNGAGTQALGLAGSNLLTSDAAISTLAQLQNAGHDISQWRGAIGAQQNRLFNAIDNISVQNLNVLSAQSTISDANMANEIVNLTKDKVLEQSGMASLAQSNLSAQAVLSLFK